MTGFLIFVTSVLCVLMLGGMGRVIMGPTVADRAMALDLLNSVVVAVMLVLAAAYDSVVIVDIAMVYAGLSFVETMYIARYIERRTR